MYIYPPSLSYPNKRTGELGARLIIALMLYAFMSRLPTASTPLGYASIFLHAIFLYVDTRCMVWCRSCLLGSPPLGMSLSIYLFLDLIIYWKIYLCMNVDPLAMPCYNASGSWCIVSSNQRCNVCTNQPCNACRHLTGQLLAVRLDLHNVNKAKACRYSVSLPRVATVCR